MAGNSKTAAGGARKWLASLVHAFIFLAGGITAAHAQGTAPLSSSYITPFPQTDRYQVRVIGDWLSSGLTAGLQEAFKSENSVQIADASRSSYGLVRAEQTGLHGDVEQILSGPPVHIVIIMLGVNDRASFKTAAGRAQPGSAEWKEVYGKEAEKLIRKLRGANVAVYWAGLPVMGNPALNEVAGEINDAVRQAAYVNGAKFIETSAGFTDQLGGYSAFGPDLTGQTKRLREGDGIGLTPAGNRKLASYIEIALRRDLAQARAQRNIPLAGDEEEQARVVPPGAHNAGSAKSASAGAGKQDGPVSVPKPSTPADSKPDTAPKTGAGFRAEFSAAASAQDAARREQAAFGSGSGQQGEFVLADLGNGLTSIAVISPLSDLSIREIQRQTPLAERLYFKVLSKGEALPAKEGRADDFRWRGDSNSQSQ